MLILLKVTEIIICDGWTEKVRKGFNFYNLGTKSYKSLAVSINTSVKNKIALTAIGGIFIWSYVRVTSVLRFVPHSIPTSLIFRKCVLVVKLLGVRCVTPSHTLVLYVSYPTLIIDKHEIIGYMKAKISFAFLTCVLLSYNCSLL